jgi:hypothetical protein
MELEAFRGYNARDSTPHAESKKIVSWIGVVVLQNATFHT